MHAFHSVLEAGPTIHRIEDVVVLIPCEGPVPG